MRYTIAELKELQRLVKLQIVRLLDSLDNNLEDEPCIKEQVKKLTEIERKLEIQIIARGA